MGEISESKLYRQSNLINTFAGTCRRMHAFLDVKINLLKLQKFKEMVSRLEIGYDA